MRYRLLGNIGLRVSETALGTMTFGEDFGWGMAKDEARLRTLDEASRIELGFPHSISAKELARSLIYGGLRDQILA